MSGANRKNPEPRHLAERYTLRRRVLSAKFTRAGDRHSPTPTTAKTRRRQPPWPRAAARPRHRLATLRARATCQYGSVWTGRIYG